MFMNLTKKRKKKIYFKIDTTNSSAIKEQNIDENSSNTISGDIASNTSSSFIFSGLKLKLTFY